MGKALKTVGLMLLLAVGLLGGMLWLAGRSTSGAGLTPEALRARALYPLVKDGQLFRLADAYPDVWETVQVLHGGDTLTDWEWRTLRAVGDTAAPLTQGQQLLVFWQDGAVAFVVRSALTTGGTPWFTLGAADGESSILGREKAVFRATLVHAEGYDYYACVPEGDAAAV